MRAALAAFVALAVLAAATITVAFPALALAQDRDDPNAEVAPDDAEANIAPRTKADLYVPNIPSAQAAEEIPPLMLSVYRYAAANAECALPWSVLAGIADVASDHGRANGASIRPNGTVYPALFGPPLDGQEGRHAVADTDAGAWDDDVVWDRALGAFQFIPSTWTAYATDGNGDHIRDPQNVWDSAASAATHLCAYGADDITKVDGAISAYYQHDRFTQPVIESAKVYAGSPLPPSRLNVLDGISVLRRTDTGQLERYDPLIDAAERVGVLGDSVAYGDWDGDGEANLATLSFADGSGLVSFNPDAPPLPTTAPEAPVGDPDGSNADDNNSDDTDADDTDADGTASDDRDADEAAAEIPEGAGFDTPAASRVGEGTAGGKVLAPPSSGTPTVALDGTPLGAPTAPTSPSESATPTNVGTDPLLARFGSRAVANAVITQLVVNFVADPNATLLAGDWTGDYDDELALYTTFDGNGRFTRVGDDGNAQPSVTFGEAGDQPLVGDWDADGVTEFAVYREAVDADRAGMFLRSDSSGNLVGAPIRVGGPGAKAVVGDWDGDGRDSLALLSPDEGDANTSTLVRYDEKGEPTGTDLSIAGTNLIPLAGVFPPPVVEEPATIDPNTDPTVLLEDVTFYGTRTGANGEQLDLWRVRGIIVEAELAQGLAALLAAAEADGHLLSGWGWRSNEQQIALRQQNCPDVYVSPPSSCRPPTAIPGTSRHEYGRAVDFNVDGVVLRSSSPEFAWMLANAGLYGFTNLPSEAWHWSDTGG